MVTSLDGKVTGEFLEKSENKELIEEYYQIHRQYGADGFLCGRVTMEGSFAALLSPPLENDERRFAREDYIAKKAKFYAVSIDPHGKLWWGEGDIADTDEGYNGAHIVEVLTRDVSDAFLAHLASRGVSYLFGGKETIDLALVARKLKELFGIEKLLLEGGGIVNGSFITEGLIDEISLVVIPQAEPSQKAVPLFRTGIYGGGGSMADFGLKEAVKLKQGGLRLVYKK
jgi:dihydrofolate reductase